MGTLRHWSFDGIAEGTTLTTANLLSDTGNAPLAVAVTGTRTATATYARSGMAGRIAATGSAIIRLPSAAAHTRMAVSAYERHDAVPANWVPFSFHTTADGSIGAPLVGTSHGLSMGPTTGSANIATGQLNRWEILIDTVAGTLSIRVFNGDATTPYCVMSVTGLSLASASIDAFQFGSINAAAVTSTWEDVQIDENRTTEIGPWLPRLATPTVTVTDQAEGTATVTWPAVAGAASYEAHNATTVASPAQGDFTLVEAGVTSPYTFTGLSADVKWAGIKAKA